MKTIKIDIFDNQRDVVVCSNHYQSDLFLDDKLNIENINMTDSKFRFLDRHKILE